MDEFLQDFLKDAKEDLQRIETNLVSLEKKISQNEGFDYDLVNNIFRYFHSIKGSSGFFKLKEVVRVAHEAENILDMYRKKILEIKENSLNSIFRVHDFLNLLIERIENFGNDSGLEEKADEIILELQNIQNNKNAGNGSHSPLKEKKFGIFGKDDSEKAEEFLPSEPRLFAEEALLSKIEKKDIKEKKFGIFEKEVSGDAAEKKSELLKDNPIEAEEKSDKKIEQSDIRIATSKLDTLVNYLGELVIVEAMVSRHANDEVLNIEMLRRSTSHLSKITRDLQEIGLSMRMIPLSGLFQKMTRLVRDVSKKSKKMVNLEISGEDTEIDKSIIEQLSNPLVHILRNAIDHGLENEEERIALKKNPFGKVSIQAKHKGSEIWIIISDDGKGLDREKILEKARQENLIDESEKEFTDEEVWSFIFLPGFSTAREVTDISGRGVGMDVVKKEIARLKGKIEVNSQKNKGTSFLLRIPLTLAIIDSMVVKFSGRYYIIPTENIERFVNLSSMKVSDIHDNQRVINLNDKLVSVVEPTEIFHYSGNVQSGEDKIAVIIGKKGNFVALKLDEIIGSQQIVVKPLDESMDSLKGLTGSGILGDGEVGLIIDAEYIVKKFASRADEISQRT